MIRATIEARPAVRPVLDIDLATTGRCPRGASPGLLGWMGPPGPRGPPGPPDRADTSKDTCGPRVGSRVRLHHVMPRSPPVAAAAAPRSNGGSRVTLANGRLAAASTTATRIRRITQPGAAATAPMTSGAPARTTAPPASATRPTAIAGATRGTTTRLTSGERTARRPNDTRMIGRVAACAASDTPRLSASQWGSRPRPAVSSQPVSGVAHAMSPAVASDESWNPASEISFGSEMRSSVTAQPRAATARPARPLSRASKTTPAISAARTTEGDAPAKAT